MMTHNKEMFNDLEEAMLIKGCLNSIKAFNDIGGLIVQPHDRELSIRLLQEELNEYSEAASNNDETEIKDALADMMYLLWGTIVKDGYESSFWDILKEVCNSNMSKFDASFEDALVTQSAYLDEKGILTTIHHNKEYNVYINKRGDGKILKSHKFKEPIL